MTRLTALLLLALSACAPRVSPGPASPEKQLPPPPPLQSARAWPYDFQWRQQVTAAWPDGSHTFDAVLSRNDDTLLLVGLSPMGLPGFVFRLDAAGALSVENRSRRELPMDPAYILADVERVFFPWFGDEPAPAEGTRNVPVHGGQLVEHYEGSVLQRREFLDAQGTLQVEVRYEGWTPGEDAPREAVLEHRAAGYTLRIETLTQSRLD